MRKEKRARKTVQHTVIRKIDGTNTVRFIEMHIPRTNKMMAFTKNKLPKFSYIAEAHQHNTIKQVKAVGRLIGSAGLMRLFPEFGKATLGQLIRYHAN